MASPMFSFPDVNSSSINNFTAQLPRNWKQCTIWDQLVCKISNFFVFFLASACGLFYETKHKWQNICDSSKNVTSQINSHNQPIVL